MCSDTSQYSESASLTMSDYATTEQVNGLVSLGRITQYAAVGTVGASVDMALLGLFHGLAGMPLVIGKLLSAELSFLLMFVINEFWTFAEYGETDFRAQLRRLVRSNTVRLGGLVTATAVLVVLTETTELWYMIANAVGIGTGFFVNYSFESLFTWQVHQS